MAKTQFNIAVIGAGLAGLGAAIALTDKGHKVTVFERNASLQTLGGAIGITPSAIRVLDQYGVLENTRKQYGERTQGIKHRRWQDGSLLLSTPAEDTKAVFGAAGIRVMRPGMQRILYDAAEGRAIDIRFNQSIVKVDQNAPSLTLENGEIIHVDLIIAADGIKSTVRTGWYPGDKRQLYSTLINYMATIPMQDLEGNAQLIPYLDSLNFWWGPKGCVVTGPVIANGQATYTLEFCSMKSDDDDESETEFNSRKYAMKDDFASFFDTWDPALRALLNYQDKYFMWPLAYTDPNLDWVSASGKILLIGDASHAVLPHTGAGAVTALEDGCALAECIARASTTCDLPDCVRAFETIRKPRIKYFQDTGTSRAQSWHIPDGPQQEARDAALKKLGSLVPDRWDGRHVDEPPSADSMHLQMAYVYGYDVVDHTNRKLNEILGGRSG